MDKEEEDRCRYTQPIQRVENVILPLETKWDYKDNGKSPASHLDKR